MADLEKVPGLEDASLAEPGKDYVPPEASSSQAEKGPEEERPFSGGFKIVEENENKEFEYAIENCKDLDDLANIVEQQYDKTKEAKLEGQAQKIRDGELPDVITREHGIRKRYMQLANLDN
ncbi:MAG TPA: hypothetical protein PLX10_02105 [Candidatus Paceibacterota bacterium]|nr:hypothetical protein [Candidatus Paceibacterota bacterium]